MIKKETIKVTGMSCSNCEYRIEKAVRKMKGTKKIKANFQDGTAVVEYESNRTTMSQIEEVIKKAGYKIDVSIGKNRDIKANTVVLGIVVLIISIYSILGNTLSISFVPRISNSMGLGMLFIAGIVTSLHCLAMCGGINLSQSIQIQGVDNRSLKDKVIPGLMYNSGRIISYTAIGGIVGGIGSVLTLSGKFKGIVAIVCGVLMLLMGLNMAGIKVKYIRFDIINKIISSKLSAGKHKQNAFYIGLLNGFMPCGPLQAMQLYALGTGSTVKGATAMLIFGLGTFPLMFTFSIVSTLISKKLTDKMVKVSAVIIMLLSIVMIGNGMSLSGVSVGGSILEKAKSSILSSDKQVIESSFSSGKYAPIKVRKGIPVKWIIHMKEEDINGCNETMNIPEYNIEKKLVAGDNIVEFTPNETGTIAYSCWMGMIRSTITVEE